MEPLANEIPESVLNGPALKPPPGIIPNFEHPPNFNVITEFTTTLCITITVIFVSIRAFVKVFCMKKVEIEDILVTLALGTFFASTWGAYEVIHTSGSFAHQWDIRLKDLGATLHIFHIVTNTFAVTLCLTKAAILMEWVRIFVPHGTRNTFYWAARSLLVLISLTYTAYLITENLSCIPHQKVWNRLIPEGYCIDDKIFQLPGALISPIWIFFVLLLPQKTIWNLQIARKHRVGISLIFLVGILALGSSIARVQATFTYVYSEDKTHTIGNVYLWTVAETTCTFLAFCAPATPRAYANRHLITDLVELFLLRVGLIKTSQRSRTGARAWPAQRPLAKKKVQWDGVRVYHRIKDTATSLTRFNERFDGNLSHPTEILGQSIPDNAILITTSFTAEVTIADESGGDAAQEYIWASSRRS